MLAIARALMLNPRLLLLDEPLEGLAPLIVQELLHALTRIVRDEGLSAIIVEQNPTRVLAMTDDAVILERGSVVHAAESAQLATDTATLDRYLAVDDSGRVVNPLMVESQVVGATVQGLGFALTEEVVWDEGRVVNPTLMDYKVPTSRDVPFHMRTIIVESPEPDGT